ncbi:unnamed protein product [Protopolystoma xenopodis]|uniref:Uncharacterized protein n=1 Tax=Protopolystoma xenopodis TaxID=117903 RepID=A0A448WHJ4_9PLAT|nr:unnamed protein product [Protopolystoma xenopodis]
MLLHLIRSSTTSVVSSLVSAPNDGKLFAEFIVADTAIPKATLAAHIAFSVSTATISVQVMDNFMFAALTLVVTDT